MTRTGLEAAINGMGGEDSQRRERSALPSGSRVTATVPDVASFLRYVFPERPSSLERQMFSDVRSAADSTPGGPTAPGPGTALMRRDYETAFTLLQRASDAFPALLRHCHQLEAEISRLQADAHNARGEMQHWQQIALTMKMHIEENEHQIALLRKRLDVAEDRLQEGQSLTRAAEQQASLAIEVTTLFHDKIIDAFGVGSAAHSALDALAQGGLGPEPLAASRSNDL